jgi:hypothetical protein
MIIYIERERDRKKERGEREENMIALVGLSERTTGRWEREKEC